MYYQVSLGTFLGVAGSSHGEDEVNRTKNWAYHTSGAWGCGSIRYALHTPLSTGAWAAQGVKQPNSVI